MVFKYYPISPSPLEQTSHHSDIAPHPQFLTEEHEPGLAFAFCTNFPVLVLLLFEGYLLEIVMNYGI